MNLSVSEVAAIGGALVVGQVGIAVIIDVVKSKIHHGNGKSVCGQHAFLVKRLDELQGQLTCLVNLHEEEKQMMMITKALVGVLKDVDKKTLEILKSKIL